MSLPSGKLGMQGYSVGMELWEPVADMPRGEMIVALHKSGLREVGILPIGFDLDATDPDPITHFMRLRSPENAN